MKKLLQNLKGALPLRACLFLIGMLCSVGVWADATYNLSSATLSNGTYTWSFSALTAKNVNVYVEVPSSTSSGTVSFKCSGNQSKRYLYIYGTSGTVKDSERKMVMSSSDYQSVAYTSSDIYTNTTDNKFYLVFSTGDDFKYQNIQLTPASTVPVAPSFASNFQIFYTTTENTAVTIGAAVTVGYPTPTYSWYACDAEGNTTGSELATTATYSVTPTEIGTTYYKETATNTQGSDSKVISVTATAAATLASIAVKTAPTKTSYTVGDTFDPTGLVITKTMSDETTVDVAYADASSDFSFTPSTSTSLTTENTSVIITYAEKTVTQAITVNAAPVAADFTMGLPSSKPSSLTDMPVTGGSLSSIGSTAVGVDKSKGITFGSNNCQLKISLDKLIVEGTKISVTCKSTSDGNNTGLAVLDSKASNAVIEEASITTDGSTYSYTITSSDATYLNTNELILTRNSSGKGMAISEIKIYGLGDEVTKHSVTYALNGGSGTAPTQADVAENVTFTVASGDGLTNEGYVFNGWNDGTNNYAAGSTYTMGTSDVTLTAQWETAYTIAKSASENGDFTVSSVSAAANATITLTANPSNGYYLESWDVYKTEDNTTKVDVTSNTFKMPAFNVTVDATFKEIKKSNDFYQVNANSAASLKACLTAAANDDNCPRVYIPNGTYDFGTLSDNDVEKANALITITASNMVIIGESMEKVIIKGTVENEGLKQALLYNKGTGNYFQNITLQCTAPYNSSHKAERSEAFFDEGKQTICKNVYLKGTQDTYFSNTADEKYFEGGQIDGTVDMICGSGKIFFEGVNLVCVKSANHTSGSTIICPDATTKSTNTKFTLNSCKITNNADSYYLGRSWKGTNTAIFANCTIPTYSAQTTDAASDGTLVITEQNDAVGYASYLGEWNPKATIVKYSATMKCSAGKLGTFCAPFDVTMPTNVTAYTATAAEGAEKVTLSKVAGAGETLEANTPVIIYNEGSDAVEVTFTGENTAPANCTIGALTGVMSAKATNSAATPNGQTIAAGAYLLQTQDGTQAFYKLANAVQSNLNKCYLTVSSPAAKLSFAFADDVTTAISEVEGNTDSEAKTQKCIENGRLVIKTVNGTYSVIGSRIK